MPNSWLTLSFSNAKFMTDASFVGAKFTEGADFSGTSFGNVAEFLRARFLGRTRFVSRQEKGKHIPIFFGTLVNFREVDIAPPIRSSFEMPTCENVISRAQTYARLSLLM